MSGGLSQESFNTKVGRTTVQVRLISQGEAVRMLVGALAFFTFLVAGGVWSGQRALDVARGQLTGSLNVILRTQEAALTDWLDARRAAAGAVALSADLLADPAAMTHRAQQAGFSAWAQLDGEGVVIRSHGHLPEGSLKELPMQDGGAVRLLPEGADGPVGEPWLLVALPLSRQEGASAQEGAQQLRLVGSGAAAVRLIAPFVEESKALAYVYDDRGRVLSFSRPDQPLEPLAQVPDGLVGSSGLNLEPTPGVGGALTLSGNAWLEPFEVGLLVEISEGAAYPIVTLRRQSLMVVVVVVGLGIVGLVVYLFVAQAMRRRLNTALSRLGQYQLHEKIGEGAMGTVWRAQHAMLRRPTAIKLIRGQEADEEDLTRFEREVRLTSRLTHPNTVAIFDFGRTPGGVFYYAMEYLPGITLQELVEREGPQPEGRVIHILRQVCASLAEAHDAGLIHRDVKPANVMLCQRGGLHDVVKVLDFGLVKEDRDTGSGLTQRGTILGTPHYMSPEAVTNPDEVDGRADLYSVAALGYFLLTGTTVFADGPPMKVCFRHVTQPPEPPSKRLGRDLSPDLESVVLRGLQKEVEDRFENARALAEALQQCDAATDWGEPQAARWWAEQQLVVTPLP